MQMWRQPVPQLTGIRRQIDAHLLELVDHEAGGRLVAAELAPHEALALAGAADDGPQEQVRHVDGDGLRQAREARRVRPDHARVAARRQGEDLKGADFLIHNQ